MMRPSAVSSLLVTLDFRMVVEVADVRQEFTFVLHLRRHVS